MIAYSIPKTRQTRVLNTISILVGGALFIVLLLHFGVSFAPRNPRSQEYEATLTVGAVTIPVTIADTELEREHGLSGTPSLAEGSGKLFIFPESDRYGFWMKDMNYSIDIIWLDTNMRIVTITHAASPQSYPTVFYPRAPAQYVLEVNAGFSTQHQLEENQFLVLTKNSSF